MKNRYYIDTISILTILTNIIRYRYGIDASGIEAEPDRNGTTKSDSTVRVENIKFTGKSPIPPINSEE